MNEVRFAVALRLALGSALLGGWSLFATAQWLVRPLPAEISSTALIAVQSPQGRVLLSRNDASTALYRSVDDGVSWQPIALDKPLFGFVDPTGQPNRQDGLVYATFLVSGGWLEGFLCELRKSADAGLTWTLVAGASRACGVAVDPANPNLLYGNAYVGENPVFRARSADGGVTWESLDKRIPFYVTRFGVQYDGSVYAIAGNIYVSRDHGSTFSELRVREQTGGWSNDYLALRHPVHGDAFALVATTTGLYRTADAGLTWQSAGFRGFQVTTLTAVPQPAGEAPAVVVGYRGGLALWTENGIVSVAGGLPRLAGAHPNPYRIAGPGVVAAPGALALCADPFDCVGGLLPGVVRTVEFHNAGLNHYFLTPEGPEAEAVDRGDAGPGWSRTGEGFEVLADMQAAPSDVAPACRFYGTPGIGPNSHFYTPDFRECAQVSGDTGWTLESDVAFAVPMARVEFDAVSRIRTFRCERSPPVLRLYNNGFARNDSNHRFTTSAEIYNRMIQEGWKGEGTVFCTETRSAH